MPKLAGVITKSDIEKPGSPRSLRKFVCCRREKVKAVTSERHVAIQKKGIYKEFFDEISPLSIFALKIYPNRYKIKPILGNQGYDAVVTDNHGNFIEYVELTFPHDGQRDAKDAKLIVLRGYGKCHAYSPGEDIERLCQFIQKTCSEKAKKDYSNCTLVIVIAFLPPSRQGPRLYSQKINQVVTLVLAIPFKAKSVFLLLLEQRKILKVHG